MIRIISVWALGATMAIIAILTGASKQKPCECKVVGRFYLNGKLVFKDPAVEWTSLSPLHGDYIVNKDGSKFKADSVVYKTQ